MCICVVIVCGSVLVVIGDTWGVWGLVVIVTGDRITSIFPQSLIQITAELNALYKHIHINLCVYVYAHEYISSLEKKS